MGKCCKNLAFRDMMARMSSSVWILATGLWDDSGIWVDSDVWND